MMNRDGFYRTYPIFGCTLFLIALLVPLCMALVPSFITAQGFDLSLLVRTFTDRDVLQAMAFTALLALGCTTVCTLLGWLGASLLTKYSLGGESFLKGLLGFAIMIPSAVTVLGIKALVGSEGFLWLLFGVPAVRNDLVLIACSLIIYYTPIEVLIVSYYWKRLDYRCEQAARTLGMTKKKAFRTITMPRLRPAIIAGSSLVFLACLTSFSSIMLANAGKGYETTYAKLLGDLDNVSQAACLVIFNTVLSLVMLVIHCTLQRKMSKRIVNDVSCHRKPEDAKGFSKNAFLFLYVIISLLLIVGPIICVIAKALLDENLAFTTSHFMNLFTGPTAKALMPLVYSLAIAALSAFVATRLALSLSISICRKPSGRVSSGFLAMMPLGIGSLTLGFGFRVLSSYLPQIPAIVLVAISHIVMRTPMTVILTRPILTSVGENLIPASRTLGFSAGSSFRSIEKPALRPALVAGFMFGLTVSLGDVSNALSIAGKDAKTISVLLFEEYSNGSLGSASALGCVLIALCFIMVLIGERHIRKCHV